ncbi:hypothetical protein [Vibrio sp. 10N.261.51.F12]|uniref:hypothetical protein n=1 Tax=Vibrio sp. 10N.261.51.F12 TaxID=3229679 RepID=UPI00354B6D38
MDCKSHSSYVIGNMLPVTAVKVNSRTPGLFILERLITLLVGQSNEKVTADE